MTCVCEIGKGSIRTVDRDNYYKIIIINNYCSPGINTVMRIIQTCLD